MTEELRRSPSDAADAGRLTLAGRLLRWLFATRLAWQFTIPSLLLMVLVGLGVTFGLTRYLAASIEEDALQEAMRDAEWKAAMVADMLSPEQLVAPMLGPQYQDMDRIVRMHVMHTGVMRVRIWSRSGRVIYSDDPSLVGQTLPVEGKLARALGGETVAEVSNLEEEENIAERDYGRLLGTYTPIRLGESPEVLGVLEVYDDYGHVAARIAVSQRIVYLGVGVGMGFVYLALLVVHVRGTMIIGRQRDKLIRQAEELKKSYHATLEALGSALDLRDHTTEGHCQRVSDLAVAVGRELGLGEEELEEVSRGALVHDIGKISLPDSILSKPGPLTDDEWQEMRKHPELGYEILKDIPALRQAAEIAYGHQEKFDGTGYPRGLKGKEILLGARIFAVVDAYDAMTSDRPYRKAVSHEEAMEEIIRCAGTQFDPEVVRAFCEAERKSLVRAPNLERGGGDGSRPETSKSAVTVSRR